MAVNTSPSLTSTSHTLTALPAPIMAPAMPNSAGDVLALLQSLRPGNRHVFLQPDASIPAGSLNLVKETLEAFAGQVSDEQAERLRESRKRKRNDDIEVLKMRKVYLDGFDTAQVWQQAKRIIGGVLEDSTAALDELEERNEVGVDGQTNGAMSDSDEEEEIDGDEEDDSQLQDDSAEDEDISEDEELEGELEGDLEDDDEEMDGLDLEGDEEDDDELDGPEEEYVEDPNGLNDGFFSIDDFNRQTQWFEEQDARGDPNTDHASDDEDINWDADPFAAAAGDSKASKASKPKADGGELEDDDEDDDDEDGPTFGNMALDAPEGDSEDEAMDDMADDDEANDFNANDVYYKDFFAPPPRKWNSDKPRKPRQAQETKKPDSADVERAMADVRRDLFDDESDMEGSDDALSEVDAGDPKSRRSAHERRQAKLAEEIRKLEAESVAKRQWTLSGEAAAAERPVNSLLEEDLDFEHVGKPVPVITPEVSESIEELIKRRILAQEFDEVLRRRPDVDAVPAGTRRGMIELEDSKSAKGLAEVYEEEHVKNANPDTYVSASDEKTQREEREVVAMWADVCGRLDALSNWHYRPKPAAPTISVVSDVAAVAMEDAQPTTATALAGAASTSRMAPQEVYKPGDANGDKESSALTKGEVVPSSGLPVARAEMSREDKLRRRRREKERMRKAGGTDAGKKPLSGKAKMQRDTMAELKKGGVKVINRKGEITDVAGNKAKAAKVASSGSYKL